jgi:hypothetical protein
LVRLLPNTDVLDFGLSQVGQYATAMLASSPPNGLRFVNASVNLLGSTNTIKIEVLYSAESDDRANLDCRDALSETVKHLSPFGNADTGAVLLGTMFETYVVSGDDSASKLTSHEAVAPVIARNLRLFVRLYDEAGSQIGACGGKFLAS